MNISYSARKPFGRYISGSPITWENYKAWSKLSHLTELISMDGMHNPSLIEPDWDNADDWNYIVNYGDYFASAFNSLEYILQKIAHIQSYNMMAIAIEPSEDCSKLVIDGFEFTGYELLDKSFHISALTNCGGFNETFSAADINQFGLIDDYQKALDIQKRLLENNPAEYHADTIIIGTWRHKTLGRPNSA